MIKYYIPYIIALIGGIIGMIFNLKNITKEPSFYWFLGAITGALAIASIMFLGE